MFFVYYEDDYADNGGLGFTCFGSKYDALSFILKRMEEIIENGRIPAIDNYRVVEGRERTLESVAVTTKLRLLS